MERARRAPYRPHEHIIEPPPPKHHWEVATTVTHGMLTLRCAALCGQYVTVIAVEDKK